MSDVDGVRAELVRALGGQPTDIAPLLGGAGRSEMWSFRVGERELVFRRHAGGDEGSSSRAREWRILRDADRAGVPVPEPVAKTETGIVMERVAGEARPSPATEARALERGEGRPRRSGRRGRGAAPRNAHPRRAVGRPSAR